MEIVFIGGSKENCDIAESMCMFAARKLMPRTCAKLFIEIEFVKNLYNDYGIYGDCTWDSHERNPKDYIVRLDDNLSLEDLLATVAHEMVHVKQYATGELKQYSVQKGYRYKNDYYPIDYNIAYRPWEIEASMLEKTLVNAWHKEFDEVLT